MSKKAIVFVTLAYSPLIGGAERQAQQLLERWVQLGEEVWVLTRRVPGYPDAEIINGVRVFRMWSIWLPVVSWLTFSFSVIGFLLPRRGRIHSLWGLMLNVSTLAVIAAARLFGCAAVIKIGSSGEGGNLQVVQRSPVGGWITFLLRQCQYVIVLNKETLGELQPYHVSDKKIKWIPNGVNTTVYQPAETRERHELRQQIGLTDDLVGVVFVGRLAEVKNLDNLLAIWPSVMEKCPQARLVLVGSGAEEASLKLWTRDHHMEDSIWFLGMQEDVLKIYQACDMFILPSYREGLSNALLEAMSCELPVIVGRVGGNLDVVSADTHGKFIDPDEPSGWVDPLVQLVQDGHLRQVYGKQARQIVLERYSIESTFREYQNVCRALEKS